MTVGVSDLSDRVILDTILFHEGSAFTNHPDDPGSATRWGITQATLSDWLERPATVDDVRDMPVETAEAIYRARYIDPFRSVPESVRVNVIDAGVNSGVRTATRLLQMTVGATVDGQLGPQTLSLAIEMDLREPLNELFTGMRLAFYENLILAKPSQIVWRNGWRARALSFTALIHRALPDPNKTQSFRMAKALGTQHEEV